MICVLRIAAVDGDQLRELAPAAAYRKDSKGRSGLDIDVLYYDIADVSDKSGLVAEINSFLERHRATLLLLAKDQNVKWINLDIGLILSKEALSTSFDMSSDLIALMGALNISLSVSAYKAS